MPTKRISRRELALFAALLMLGVSVAGCINAADLDGDGVLDSDDLDDDGDGMPDAFERDWSLNPLNGADGALDADHDGLSNLAEFTNHTVPRVADSDDDGIYDGYEVAMGLNPLDGTDAGLDADGDGASNRQEFIQGTSAVSADTDVDGANDGWEIEHHFDPLDAGDAAGDADGDGLSNLLEFNMTTDPRNADTDGDTMPDGWERAHGLNAVDAADAALDDDADAYDADRDGTLSPAETFTNAREFAAGTNPEQVDSDNDTMSDGFEWSYGLKPLDAADAAVDQDADGLTNAEEWAAGTSPASNDTDGDSMHDAFELAHGLNATNASDAAEDPDGDGLPNAGEAARGGDPRDNDTDHDGALDGVDADPAHDLGVLLRIIFINVTFKNQPTEAGFDPPWEIQFQVSINGGAFEGVNLTVNGSGGTGEDGFFGYIFIVNVPDGPAGIDIVIAVAELDLVETVGVNADDTLDIDPTGNNDTLAIVFNMATGAISGEVTSGAADGAADGRNGEHDARIDFVVETYFA